MPTTELRSEVVFLLRKTDGENERLPKAKGIETRYGARSRPFRPELGPALRSGAASVPIGRQCARKGPQKAGASGATRVHALKRGGVDFNDGSALASQRQTLIGRAPQARFRPFGALPIARGGGQVPIQVPIAKRGQFRGAEGGPTSVCAEGEVRRFFSIGRATLLRAIPFQLSLSKSLHPELTLVVV